MRRCSSYNYVFILQEHLDGESDIVVGAVKHIKETTPAQLQTKRNIRHNKFIQGHAQE